MIRCHVIACTVGEAKRALFDYGVNARAWKRSGADLRNLRHTCLTLAGPARASQDLYVPTK